MNSSLLVQDLTSSPRTELIHFIIVEDMPQFRGEGLEGFHNWVKKYLKYPEIAVEKGIKGKVYIQFVVNKNGKREQSGR